MTSSFKNRLIDKSFEYFGLTCTLLGVLALTIFLTIVIQKGITKFNFDFFLAYPSRFASKAGIFTSLMGTLWLMVMTSLLAIPLGISAALYLEEYSNKSKFNHLLELNIANLAGVPSIIYGILGLQVFVRLWHLGGSILAGALTLSLLILPIIIVATRESLRAVPKSIREASFAMGASKWQTIWYQVIPAASGGMITGIILAISRAIGEAAPIIVAGAVVYVPFIPDSPMSEYSAMPLQIFNWISRPQKEFAINAAAGIMLLLFITFLLNGVAVYLRAKMRKKVRW